MRVLFVALDFKPRHGGVAELTHRLALELHRLEDAVTVLTRPDEGGEAFDAGVEYRVVRDPGLDEASRLERVGRIGDALRDAEADVLVVNHLEPLGHQALLASSWQHVPVVVMAHGTEVNRSVGHGGGSQAVLAEPRGRFWKGVALRGAMRVTCSSRYTAERVRAWGVAPARIRVVHPGADPVSADERERRRDIWRRRLEVPPEAPLAAFVGRLVARKGPDLLVDAFATVRERLPGARLIVAGQGPLAEHLEAAAARSGADASVRVLGAVTEEEKDGLLCAADVVALPNRELDDGDVEGFGIVLREAAARGVPAVAGRSGGVPEAVDDGRTGLLVDASEPAPVADALITILSDPERARRMGRAAREAVERDGTWAAAGASFRSVCAEVAGASLR